MLVAMVRAVFLLALLAAFGAAIAWLAGQPPPDGAATRQAPATATPAVSQAGLATPFGDAVFRWRCTTGLRDALGDRPGWPLERVATLCLCAADRLREDGLRDIVVGAGDIAVALEAAEARLCRGR